MVRVGLPCSAGVNSDNMACSGVLIPAMWAGLLCHVSMFWIAHTEVFRGDHTEVERAFTQLGKILNGAGTVFFIQVTEYIAADD